MNPFERLEAIVLALEEANPAVSLSKRALKGTYDEGDHLIVERRVGADVRIVRVGATARSLFSFYWGYLPPPRGAHEARHGEGNLYGDVDYLRFFLQRFLIDGADWREIPPCKLDGTPPEDAP